VSVIVVAPFTREISDAQFQQTLQERFGVDVEIHFVRCSRVQRFERMKQRANPRDTSKLANWDEFLKYYGSETGPACPHIIIETE
jgi:hypothetical protein